MSSSLPVRHPDAVHVDASESGHVLLRRDDGTEHLVNETALALWQLCDGATTTEEMIEGVCALFSAPRDAIAGDIQRALNQLWRAGLVRWPDDLPADAGAAQQSARRHHGPVQGASG